MAHIRLDIGADRAASLRTMKEDISAIVDALNKEPKLKQIKLGLNMSELSKDANKLKTKINELRKDAAEIKFSDQISNSLNGISSSLKTLTDSVAGVSGLKTELNSLSEAMRNFQGVSISLSSSKNPVQQMSQYGKAARALIVDLKAQATDMERVLSSIYGGRGVGALDAAGRGLNINNRIWRAAGTDSLSLQKALTDDRNLSKQMDAYSLYIRLMKSVASYGKIDMTPILRLDELEKGYAAVEKLRTGEQQAETEAKRLKGIFGSDINSEQLIGKLDEIRLAIDRIVESLTNLSAKEVKIKFDDASLENLRTQISQLLTEMSAITPKPNKSSGSGGSNASAAKESKSANDEATKRAQSNVETAHKKAEAEATRQAAQAERDKAKATRNAAAESKRAETVSRNYTQALGEGARKLRAWSGAARSNNQESRQAYQRLVDAYEDLRKAGDTYGKDSAQAEAATKRLKKTLGEVGAILVKNGDDVQSLGVRLKGLAQKFGSWLSVSQIIMYAVRTVKKMISTSIELESAMTQLKIVTNATDTEMQRFSDTAFDLAKKLGKSTPEVLKTIETFSRLGYSLEDASKLSEYATILSNVANVSNEEATTGLTSIIKGYNLKVEDAEHVADLLVSVGQSYAVSASEMMEAYEKSGAALNATNTSLEKSAGLIAAANASVQDSSVVGKEMPSLTVM